MPRGLQVQHSCHFTFPGHWENGSALQGLAAGTPAAA